MFSNKISLCEPYTLKWFLNCNCHGKVVKIGDIRVNKYYFELFIEYADIILYICSRHILAQHLAHIYPLAQCCVFKVLLAQYSVNNRVFCSVQAMFGSGYSELDHSTIISQYWEKI